MPKKNRNGRVSCIGINEYIDKEDFTIHYAMVDDAVAMVTEYGKGCIMAKIDLKAAFCMVPIVSGTCLDSI